MLALLMIERKSLVESREQGLNYEEKKRNVREVVSIWKRGNSSLVED